MELLLDGVKLMVLGMVATMAFLVLMIICMGIMYRVLKPFAARFEPAPKAAPAPAASGDDARLAAVAAAAVELFRRNH